MTEPLQAGVDHAELRRLAEAATTHLASPELTADEYGLMVWGKSLKGGDSHVFDVRGWGELTGGGGGALKLSESEGIAVQRARQAYLVAAWNAVPALLNKIDALRAAPVLPDRGWRLPTEVPDVAAGQEAWFVVAVKRGHNGKVYSFGGAYLNGIEMFDEDEGDSRVFTGWYDTSNDDDRTMYQPIIGNNDELMGWCDFPVFQPLPDAPAEGAE